MSKLKKQIATKERRKKRVKAKVRGNTDRPRLSVFRSNRGFYLQIIDDAKGITLVSAHSRELKSKDGNNIKQAIKLGELLGKKAIEKKIKKVVFDKSAYRYHGRVKAIADAARQAGLEF
jgi:large subunit ribosomal protein L18